MKQLRLDTDYLTELLVQLLEIPSPTGYTDAIVHRVGQELESLGLEFELTRRGAIRAELKGKQSSPDRALVVHLDTIGAIVTELKDNGRLSLLPIGHWSSRFAEGARVTIFTDTHSKRGTVLPLKASGHAFDTGVDTQPVSWDNLEIRTDEVCFSRTDLADVGFHVGDFVGIDSSPEIIETGYIVARHLDDKAGAATLLACAKAIIDAKVELPVDCHLLFTISEEVGSGASAVLHRDCAEMVTIDNATAAPGQNTSEQGVTVCIKDSSGPFDYHLTHKLLQLCEKYEIMHQRDVFKFYRSDSASALSAGNDIRTALVCFGIDASHGYERTHVGSLASLGELVTFYMQSEPTFQRDKQALGPLKGFPVQPE